MKLFHSFPCVAFATPKGQLPKQNSKWPMVFPFFCVLMIACSSISAWAQSTDITGTDSVTFFEQESTTVWQPVCPHDSGPLYFSTLAAGRSGPYLSRTELSLSNGTEADAEGELKLFTSEGSLDSVELVHCWRKPAHGCTDSIPQDGSFDHSSSDVKFTIPKGYGLEMRLEGVGALWVGWAELKGEACARSVFQMAQATDDGDGNIDLWIIGNLVAEVELFPTYGSKRYSFPLFSFNTLSFPDFPFISSFRTAYSIVNLSSSAAKVRLKERTGEFCCIELAPGERWARYDRCWRILSPPATACRKMLEVESDQPLAVSVMKTLGSLPFLSIPTIAYTEKKNPD